MSHSESKCHCNVIDHFLASAICQGEIRQQPLWLYSFQTVENTDLRHFSILDNCNIDGV